MIVQVQSTPTNPYTAKLTVLLYQSIIPSAVHTKPHLEPNLKGLEEIPLLVLTKVLEQP
jgi:hypothetical protein